ncbi:MAG: ABC transporter permease [Treponema sp.]|jgi:spermidine/putrescine transport system permease protein|nr:ABC transporter permease [Treponema sp.]
MMKKRRDAAQKIYITVIISLMYVPIVLMIVYSFNRSRLNSVWDGFTLAWYGELFRDRAMFTALGNSVILALLSSLAAAFIGTLGAAGAVRGGAGRRPPGAGTMEYLAVLPIMTPEIILGMVLLAFFSLLGLPFGMTTLVIAHTSFCIPYVYLIVKARLAGLDKSCVEAARNLGATEAGAFWDILFPLMLPAVISGMLLSFAMSFDDVIISVFVTGVNTNTLPVRIYSQIKTGVTPKTNALCTLLFAFTVLLCLLSAWFSRPGDGET